MNINVMIMIEILISGTHNHINALFDATVHGEKVKLTFVIFFSRNLFSWLNIIFC